MNGTIIQQGRFTSDGTIKNINLRSDVDWMEVYNSTVADDDTQTTAVGVQYYWQRGMASDTGFEYKKSNAANATQLTTLLASGGFILENSATATVGAAVTGTTITKANPAVCTAAGHGYSNGDTVVLSDLTNMPQLGGVLFTIGSVATNTFELSFMDTNTGNFTQEAAFTVRKFPSVIWNNSGNFITSVTTGATTQFTTASSEGTLSYVVGDIVKFQVPAAFGMTELNGLSGEITAYTAGSNLYTVAIDSSAFTAFAWPAPSAVPFSFAIITGAGNVSTTVTGATTNEGTLQMKLAPGADSPAGITSDVIYWRAGKSFSVTNE